MERMKADGLGMDRMTYGVLMFLHSRKGDHDECVRVNQEMEAVRPRHGLPCSRPYFDVLWACGGVPSVHAWVLALRPHVAK